jgi:uncharacterized protein (TIGR03437 family)
MNYSPLRFRSLAPLFFLGLTAAVPSAFSQTLTITGGQGQLIIPTESTQAPLQVLLLGTNGQPLVGATVTFTSLDTLGGYVPTYYQNVVTDNTGTAQAYYVGSNLIPGQAPVFDTGQVIASYQGIASATFFVTTSNIAQGGAGAALVGANFANLNASAAFNGTAGSVSATPIQIAVLSQTNSSGVPDVAVSLVITGGSTGSISCQEAMGSGYVLTNASGIATCTIVYGAVGSGSFTVNVGNAINSNYPIPYSVNVGPPALIQITGGNNQSGTPGQTLPLPLVAVVTDLGGNPVSGVNMAFTSVTPNGATFTNVRTMTDPNGKVSANVVLGSVPGNITISLADTAGQIKNPAIFTETVNLTISGITIQSGNNQTAFINSAFANPLYVLVNTSAGLTAGSPVTFTLVSGSATLTYTTTTTNQYGQAFANVTAGSTAGPVVITATSGSYSVTFNLTVIPPGPSNLTFENGASGAVNSFSPGSLLTIYGSGIANNLQGVTAAFDVGPLPLTLAGTTVEFGTIYAPIFDIGNVNGSQFITVQIPREVTPGSVNLTVATSGGGSTTVPVTIAQASPGIFTYQTTASATQYAVVIKSNGSVAGPANPATRGETVVMYLTGVPLTPGISTNTFPAPGSTASPAYPIILGVANQGTPYQSVAYSPDLPAVETITFTVPASVTPGAVVVAIGVQTPSGVVYSQGATLNVQ